MKKLLFIVGLALTSLTVSAQEQEVGLPAGLFTLEWKFNPFDYESKPVKVAQLNARMFLNDKSAVRLGVGGTSTTETFSKITNDALTLRFSLGYEYHFANTGRLDFYGGAEGGYLGRFYSATKELSTTTITPETTSSIVNTTYENAEYKKRSSDGDKLNENGIFGSVFTGIDYYIYKKLYIGAELGITFNMGKKSNGNYRQTIGTTVVSESASKYSSETGIYTATDGTITHRPIIETKGTYTKVYIEPSIRIGWMF